MYIYICINIDIHIYIYKYSKGHIHIIYTYIHNCTCAIKSVHMSCIRRAQNTVEICLESNISAPFQRGWTQFLQAKINSTQVPLPKSWYPTRF